MATAKRVLVAEDEWLVRLLIVEVLGESGIEVLEAENGLVGMAMLDGPYHVAMLVTDVRMPGADGVALARKARAMHPGIPLLFLTATPWALEGKPDLLPYKCLPKPFVMTAMVRTVKGMLRAQSRVP